MIKKISILLAACMVITLAACGGKQESKPTETQAPQSVETGAAVSEKGDWTREGYYSNEDDYMLSITWMEDIDEPGWYVGCFLGDDPIEDSWGGTIPVEGNALKGEVTSSGEKDPLTVTITEEGEDGLQLVVDGGETYHFVPAEMQEATIMVTINVDGFGNIAYAEGEETPEVDPENPYQSAQINLAEPTKHTLLAWPDAGNKFVKWTKNGEDFSTDAQITVLLDETAEFIAVFEEDGDWQNPVMNFVGEYQCDRAHAMVESFGNDEAWISIDWGGSATEMAHWDIIGNLNTETLTIAYSGCTKSIIKYDEEGKPVAQETEYEDGTGTIVFNEDGTFTWHEDQSEGDSDMVFEWVQTEEQE